MVSADSHRIPRAPCYWGSRQRSRPGSAYGAVTRCGPPSQGVRLPDRFDALRPAPGGDGNSAPRQHRTRNPRRVIARARFSHHPLPLATTHGISTPAGTEMFHFPASPPAPYDIQTRVTPHNGRRVPPFGNPRITARKPAPRGISQATASFIGPRCQGIHRTLIKTNNTQHNTTHDTTQRARPPHDHDAPTAPGHDDHRATAAHARRAPHRRAPHDEPNKKTNKRATSSTIHDTAAARRCSRPLCSSQPTRPQPPTPPKQEGPKGPGHQGAPPQNPTACHAPHTPRPATSGDPDGPPHTTESRRSEGGGPRAPPHGEEPAPPAPAAKKNPLERR